MELQETLALAEIYKLCGSRKQAIGKVREVLKKYNKNILSLLNSHGFIKIAGNSVSLSGGGSLAAVQAERTVCILKVFCMEILGLTAKETQEHLEILIPVMTPHLLEKYCTLIGHCYAHDIPAGTCCAQAKEYNAETVIPLSRLPLNTSAGVVYVRTALQPSLLKLYDLGIYPGQTIRIQQLYPAYILATKQGNIALDGTLAKFIFVQKI